LKIHGQISFVFKKHVIYQMEGRQEIGFLGHRQIGMDVQGKIVGIAGQFLGDLGQGPRTFLDNFAQGTTRLGIPNVKGMIAAHASNATLGFGLNGGNFLTPFPIHDV